MSFIIYIYLNICGFVDMIEFVADAFTEKTGVPVEFINLKGELADRVRAEKENPQADIMYGGASSLFIEMAGEGVFEPTTPAWASELDDMFKAQDGSWYGTIKTPVMMFYNKELLSEDQAPKDWSDLAKPEYKDLIISRDSVSSSIRATMMSILYQYDKDGKLDEGWDFLSKLDANMKNYYNSGSMLFQAVGKKEAAIKNAPHPNAAKAFVEFAGSAEMQSKIANEFNRIPTLTSALESSPEWMKTEYKAMDTDWGVVSQKQSEWLQKWNDEIN
ncbi:MAG: extracellular solute-binding protein [Proteocatella sp.]